MKFKSGLKAGNMIGRLFRLFAILGMRAKSTDKLSLWTSLKAFVRMMRDTYSRKYHPGYGNLMIGTLVILYVISPLDLLPGFFLDDVAIVYFALKYFNKELFNYLQWEKSLKYKTVITDARIVDE